MVAATRARGGSLPADLHQHDLRHRRVTKWPAEGKSAALVREAMGHPDLRTMLGYSHLAKEHLRAAVATWLPARRAARVDPLRALRVE